MKALLIFLVLISLIGCDSAPSEKTKVDTVRYPSQESWNTHLTITHEGRKTAVMQAAHVRKFADMKITLISDGLTIDFFNDQGQHTSILTAKGGELKDVRQDMLAYGNVIVTSDSGAVLFSDTLRWDNKKQKIISEIPVKIVTKTDTLFGDTFISGPNLENYQLTNSRGYSHRKLKEN